MGRRARPSRSPDQMEDAMKALTILVTALGLALWPAAALASCTTTTVVADGQVRVCTVCVYPGGQTTVTCL